MYIARMPKKFKGENTKAAAARARKSAAAEEEKSRKEKEAEDAFWQDDDKHVAKKMQRKEEREKKRIELLQKKKEKQLLLDEEMASIKSAKPATQAKVTRAEIEKNQAEIAAQAAAEREKKDNLVHDEVPLEENLNRLVDEDDSARTVEDAISVLSVKEPAVDRHPEKRMKAAFTAFEEVNMPRLKAENPNMRLSQLKQMLKKEWMKSPSNPMNQRTAAFNSK